MCAGDKDKGVPRQKSCRLLAEPVMVVSKTGTGTDCTYTEWGVHFHQDPMQKTESAAIVHVKPEDIPPVSKFEELAGSFKDLKWRIISRPGGATMKPTNYYRLQGKYRLYASKLCEMRKTKCGYK